MDEITTIEELKNIIKTFCESRNWGQFHNPKDIAIGISTEANELLQHFRFKSIEDINAMMNSERKNQIADELADILYFTLLFSYKSDIDLANAFKNKMAKNEQKYPKEKVFGSNKKYDEY